jgi:hypothetical protein
MERETRLADG